MGFRDLQVPRKHDGIVPLAGYGALLYGPAALWLPHRAFVAFAALMGFVVGVSGLRSRPESLGRRDD
jgi:hypothetical protein